ncbi:DUF3027 domain-containing protein [Gleimia hominis]|uniref:DUF3027 domain-containing protein n=1 Tax=Gleimia hominis TaxID=595468 RepID=UPI000C80FD95|nr:DUF3027 domain-containing protein [Gleimia hominis]WIK63805.1 DUF3027 domain-containing protein [Gleimia hominis]
MPKNNKQNNSNQVVENEHNTPPPETKKAAVPAEPKRGSKSETKRETTRATKRAGGPRVDKVLQSASTQARELACQSVHPEDIGQHIGDVAEGERLHTHYYECLKEGYVGWHWAVTVARAPRQRQVTMCEVNLLPGKGALLAPDWVPWEDRLEPSDVTPSDILPYQKNDERLEARETEDAAPLKRPRELSQQGEEETVERWETRRRRRARRDAKERAGRSGGRRNRKRFEHNNKPQFDATCDSCGFLLSIEGKLGDKYGVCSNEWSADDGRVVALKHACGAHSETGIKNQPSQWPITPTHLDENNIEVLS